MKIQTSKLNDILKSTDVKTLKKNCSTELKGGGYLPPQLLQKLPGWIG